MDLPDEVTAKGPGTHDFQVIVLRELCDSFNEEIQVLVGLQPADAENLERIPRRISCFRVGENSGARDDLHSPSDLRKVLFEEAGLRWG